MKRSPSRRKCRCCNQFFVPDPRTSDRQRYCSKPACRQASKAASQRRWLSRNGNGDYFRGPTAVGRVQRWRQRHPGYWRRRLKGTQTLDIQAADPAQSSCNAANRRPPALQDDCLTQEPCLGGASLHGDRQHVTRGHRGHRPPTVTSGAEHSGLGEPGNNLNKIMPHMRDTPGRKRHPLCSMWQRI